MDNVSPRNQEIIDAQNEECNKAYALEQEKLAYMYHETFKSPVGQAALKDLRERCNMDVSCVRGDVQQPDPYAVMFQEGKRAVFNHIMTYIRQHNERIKRQI